MILMLQLSGSRVSRGIYKNFGMKGTVVGTDFNVVIVLALYCQESLTQE